MKPQELVESDDDLDLGDVVEEVSRPPQEFFGDSNVERFEELPGVGDVGEYGPARHWKDRVVERQKEWGDTSEQHVRNETKLGRHFRKRKTKYPDARDVFLCEMSYLRDLDDQLANYHVNECEVGFGKPLRNAFCNRCSRVHDVMSVETSNGTVWSKGDGVCVATHNESRQNLVVPDQREGRPVSVEQLKGDRLTEILYEDGSMEVLEDDWKRVGKRKLAKPLDG